jgi:cob(I)alamin adenosyltransferase
MPRRRPSAAPRAPRSWRTKTIEKGLLIVHTGKGSGQSTAAFGMVTCCLGHGLKVGVVVREGALGDRRARLLAERFPELVTINTHGGLHLGDPRPARDIAAARAAWEVQAKALTGRSRL